MRKPMTMAQVQPRDIIQFKGSYDYINVESVSKDANKVSIKGVHGQEITLNPNHRVVKFDEQHLMGHDLDNYMRLEEKPSMEILSIEKNYNGRMIDVEEAYLDYFNNYLTVGRFAEDYEITEEQAKEIINQGRKLNHSRR